MPVSQLRIAMLSAHSCPVGKLGTKDTGGMSVYIREIAYELGKQGHLVDIYTRVHDPEDRQIYELNQNARLIHLKAGEDEEIHKLAVYSHLPDFVGNLENFRRQNDLQYDLIFSHYWLSALAGTYLQQRWHVPHIAMFHTLGAVKNAFREGDYLALDEDEPRLRIETERDLLQKCHHIISPTEREKEELIRHYGASSEKISVVPCGVNLKQFKALDKAQARQYLGLGNDKIILFVGRIDPLKGIDKLIKALPYLRNIQGLRLLVIGGGEHSQHEIEQLRKLACNLKIENSVTFLDLVKHEQLPYFYSAADVCVVPSYYESFGLVALESLACGTPVVATDVGDFKSIIREGETGYVVRDNIPHRLADKIALLLSRPSTDKKSAQLIRATVSKFSWSNIAEAVIRDCQLVLANYLIPVS
ncbi:MAG: glycosyltransferase family 1 protein [Dehalococcoidia bacterium]|nr:MAG: glycosyltransferase family 1 protein [Dehalococcoidia bacterium]